MRSACCHEARPLLPWGPPFPFVARSSLFIGPSRASPLFLLCSNLSAILSRVSDPADKLTPADPRDLAEALAFALRYQGRKRTHNADEIMAQIVAKRLVEHLERAGFVVMKRPPIGGGAALGRGFESA